MSTSLAISHNLFLTREERYDWYGGKNIETIGVSVPTWFAKGATSEPAVEVFCKYKLSSESDSILVKHYDEGYEIIVPRNPKPRVELPIEIWESLSSEEQNTWLGKNEPNPSIYNLLDIKDGGINWLAFKQYSTLKKDKKTLNLIHFVEINTVESLKLTLC